MKLKIENSTLNPKNSETVSSDFESVNSLNLRKLLRRQEPNDTIPQAIETGLSSAEPTSRFIGRIGNNRNIPATSDVDFFKVQVNTGDTITIDIDADELRSPLDSVLRLFDSTGNEVASSDDTPYISGDLVIGLWTKLRGIKDLFSEYISS